MATLNLSQQLSGHVFAFVFVYTRLAAGMMLFPGLSETFVPARIRLMLGLLLTFLVFMPLMPSLPPAPASIPDLALMLFRESLVGLFFGLLLRLLMNTVETAGSVIAVQLGLSNAMILNPAMASQSALPSAFLSTAAMALVFATGLDHLLLRGLLGTYNLFPPNGFLPPGDMLQTFAHFASRSFNVGVEIAAPFLVVSLLLYTIMGVIQRLSQQLQVFLLVLPIQIYGGLILFAITVSVILTVWLRFFDESFGSLFIR